MPMSFLLCCVGSPFVIDYLDASEMKATGEGLGLVPAHCHTEFLVHTPAANLKELSVEVTGPDGRSIPAHLRDNGNGTYRVDWVPSAVGKLRFSFLLFFSSLSSSTVVRQGPVTLQSIEDSPANVSASSAMLSYNCHTLRKLYRFSAEQCSD
jgi:hypothetical protein